MHRAFFDRIPTALWTIAALMLLSCAVANVGRLIADTSALTESVDLERLIPDRFGDWQLQPQLGIRVVNPQARELLDKLYSQTLTRTYTNSAGYRIMLSIAYGSDQRGALQAHKPEICYPAQGFVLHHSMPGEITLPDGTIPVRRLLTSKGPRREPVTYWMVVADRTVRGALDRRLAELQSMTAGRIPDGLLFRISSIDADESVAHRAQETFAVQLLAGITGRDRARLSGLTGI